MRTAWLQGERCWTAGLMRQWVRRAWAMALAVCAAVCLVWRHHADVADLENIYASAGNPCREGNCACRGYLAKGVLLRSEGRRGDADRAFLQARFLAPKELRNVVDRIAVPDS